MKITPTDLKKKNTKIKKMYVNNYYPKQLD